MATTYDWIHLGQSNRSLDCTEGNRLGFDAVLSGGTALVRLANRTVLHKVNSILVYLSKASVLQHGSAGTLENFSEGCNG